MVSCPTPAPIDPKASEPDGPYLPSGGKSSDTPTPLSCSLLAEIQATLRSPSRTGAGVQAVFHFETPEYPDFVGWTVAGDLQLDVEWRWGDEIGNGDNLTKPRGRSDGALAALCALSSLW